MFARIFLAICIVQLGFPASSAKAEPWSEAIATAPNPSEFEQLAKEFDAAVRSQDQARALELFHKIRQHEYPMMQLFRHQGGLSRYLDEAHKYLQTTNDETNVPRAQRMVELVTLLLDEDMRLARKESVDPVFVSNWESGSIWRLLMLNDKEGLVQELEYLEQNNLKPKKNMTFLWAYQYGRGELVPIMLQYGLRPHASEIYVLTNSFDFPAIKHLFGLLSQHQISELLASNPRKIHTHGVILLAIAAADYEFLTFLMEAGFDPSFSDKDLTPLILAQKRNDERAISILRSYGVE